MEENDFSAFSEGLANKCGNMLGNRMLGRKEKD